MKTQIDIRETTREDAIRILALYPQVFPEEELRPLVTALLELDDDLLSLAAFAQDKLVGHVIFTICGTAASPRQGALLGPLGVAPDLQRSGLGTALVRAGLGRMRDRGIAQAFVLGDPAYYQRFGFLPEKSVLPPYPLPAEWADAWRSLTLSIRPQLEAGSLELPPPWMVPGYWGA